MDPVISGARFSCNEHLDELGADSMFEHVQIYHLGEKTAGSKDEIANVVTPAMRDQRTLLGNWIAVILRLVKMLDTSIRP